MSESSETHSEEKMREMLREWRQGDYVLDAPSFIFCGGFDDDQPLVLPLETMGWVVVSQTCDVVGYGEGRDVVVVCPLVEATPGYLNEIRSGRTPAAAALEHAPSDGVVVDLNRFMTVSKTFLVELTRVSGFTDDAKRAAFADSLARKHGRFAFPDEFSDKVLSPLRTKLMRGHGKDSDNGNAYWSIDEIRVAGSKNWETIPVEVGFYVILKPEKERRLAKEKIQAVIKAVFDKLDWPKDFPPQAPAFTLTTLDDLTAREYVDSQKVDLDFISSSS